MSEAGGTNDVRNDWIGTVLAALGEHIRALEDKVRELKYQNDSHEAFREFDRDQIRKMQAEIEGKLEGSITEQLAIDNNALIEVCRHWTSWAGQAQAFRKNMIAVLEMIENAGSNPRGIASSYLAKINAGEYDIIPMPGTNDAKAREPTDDASGAYGGERPEEQPDAPKTYAGSFVHLGDAIGSVIGDIARRAAGGGLHTPIAGEDRTGEPGQGDRGSHDAALGRPQDASGR